MYILFKFLISNFLWKLLFLTSLICRGIGQVVPEDGFYKREYSLNKPYSGNGMTMPYWDFRDNTMLTGNYIRLTYNHQGQRGAIWNKIPNYMRDWEMHVHFKIHGGGRALAADGLALWYTKDRMTPGPVFGGRDEFTGLGVFLDTYKNGPKATTFPQISAMVGNGSMQYDHANDGLENSFGNCLASFRNKDYDTVMSVRYAKQRLTIKLDVDDKNEWRDCIDVDGVKLPSGYFWGASAATGDLADNHDIISIKIYQLEVERTTEEENEDWATVMPSVSYLKPPIDNVDESGTGGFRNVAVSGFKLFLIILCVAIGVVICGVVGYVVFQKRQENSRKRFY